MSGAGSALMGIGSASGDPDDETSDLQFRNHCEWAVGHGVAVEVPDQDEKGSEGP